MEGSIQRFSSKCLEMLNTLEKQITTNLSQVNVETRPAKSNGIGCLLLLPTILVTSTCLDKVSLLYKITTCISVGLLFYSIIFTLLLSTSCAVLKETVYGGCVSSGLISTMLIYVVLKQDLTFSICVSMLSTYIFSSMLRISLVKLQKTFTIGEAIVVTQAITLFTVMSIIKYVFNITDGDEEMEFIYTIIYLALLTVGLAVVLLCLLPEAHKNIVTLGYVVLFCAIFALSLLHYILGPYCLLNILHYIFVQQSRWKMFLFWLMLLVCAVIALVIRTKLATKADTVTRKIFHILASLVFISGVLFDGNLMMLAAGIGFGVIVLVEALRKSGIEPVSSALHSAFLVYSDEKDCGSFAMTPLYLYVGLWLPQLVGGGALERLAGALSAGLGDSAASWAGARLGRHHWPDSSKTYEGTAFNILSQVATVYVLQLFELLATRNALLRTAIAATASALVEASTDQVDNLILPPVTLIAFQFTRFMS